VIHRGSSCEMDKISAEFTIGVEVCRFRARNFQCLEKNLLISCVPRFSGAGSSDTAKLMSCCLVGGVMSPLKLDIEASKSQVGLKIVSMAHN
jgi:hypothetical protein